MKSCAFLRFFFIPSLFQGSEEDVGPFSFWSLQQPCEGFQVGWKVVIGPKSLDEIFCWVGIWNFQWSHTQSYCNLNLLKQTTSGENKSAQDYTVSFPKWYSTPYCTNLVIYSAVVSLSDLQTVSKGTGENRCGIFFSGYLYCLQVVMLKH